MAVSSLSPVGNSTIYPSFKADEAGATPSARNKTVSGEDQEKPQGRISSQDESFETYGPTGRLNRGEEKTSETADAENQETTEEQDSKSSSGTEDTEYTQEEQKEIQKLENRDKEVKAHEQAHLAAAGRYARGGAHFEYQTGPNGRKYAVGGEVSIDLSKESGDPRATIAKMQTIIRSALAPAEPSGQDRAVAAKASRIEMEARTEATAKAQEPPMDSSQQNSKPENNQQVEPGNASMDASYQRSSIDIYM